MTPRRFPPGFLWGTATAAHQVEGGNSGNQWWDWEQQPGKIWNGDRSGDACGWWRGAEADFDRMAALGLNAHRMSVEWSRVEPADGAWDTAAVARYREMLRGLRDRGITPMVTLHHFTDPRWLARGGGWLNPETPARFARFAGRLAEELGDLCQLWCTINEPFVYASFGYVLGEWPPGEHSMPRAMRVGAALLRGHTAAAEAVRRAGPQHQVGIVHRIQLFDPASPRSRDVAVTALYDYLFNGAVLRALRTGRIPPPLGRGEPLPGLRESSDFIGINYYTRELFAFDARSSDPPLARRIPAPGVQSDRGRDGKPFGVLYPQGMERTIRRVAKLGLPIYVAETGVPDADDDLRPEFLLTHLGAIHRAIQGGADVRGVFVWSMVDNFEWAEGWGLQFGLYALDRATGARTLRRSGALFGALARANALPGE